MRFVAIDLDSLKLELEREFDALENPAYPRAVFTCATADMPSAADYPNTVLRNSTLNILAVSDGVNWLRQDTGAAI